MTDTVDHDPPASSIPNFEVINGLAEPEKKKEPQGKAKDKDVHSIIVGAMTHDKLRTWSKFPVKLHRWVDHRGESLVFEEDESGIVREVSNGYVESLIATYWKHIQLNNKEIFIGTMTAEDATKTRKLFMVTSKARTEPFPLLTWKSDPRPSLRKIPFDPLPLSACHAPLFAELMSRTTNAGALMSWIGSIFDEKSQLQQYVWMFGDGNNGKGTLVRCLINVLGIASKGGETAPGKRPSAFWTSGLVGKRLVVFPDCDEPDFVTSGLFKSLTGEDDIRVEIKGGAILSMRLPVKLMFTSNERPTLSGSKSDLRRVIYCSVAEATDLSGWVTYEADLMAEAPAFISGCWHHYLQASDGNPRAVFATSNHDEVADVVSDAEHELEAFATEWLFFEKDENGMVVAPQGERIPPTAAVKMSAAMEKAGFKTEGDRRRLRKYLRRKHGIYYKKVRFGKANFKAFEHVRIIYGTDLTGSS